MSAHVYEPLRAVPPLEDLRQRMGWLLAARAAARRSLDAALAAPRKAAGYAARLAQTVGLRGGLSWLRRIALRLGRPLAAPLARLGKSGALALAAVALSTPLGQAAIGKVGGWFGRSIGWLGRGAAAVLGRGLRLLGRPGRVAADTLHAGAVWITTAVRSVSTPVIRRARQVWAALAPQWQLLAGVARSFLLHKVLRSLIANPLVRMVVEGLIIPALVDSRVARWVRRQLRVLRLRAQALRDQEQTVGRPTARQEALARLRDRRAYRTGRPLPDGHPGLHPDLTGDGEMPTPSNRAERRAQDRQMGRHRPGPEHTA